MSDDKKKEDETMTSTAMVTEAFDLEAPRTVKRTRGATKTRMAGHEGPGLHYKEVRTTIALLLASTLAKGIDTTTRTKIQVVVDRNFDLSGLPDDVLEAVFATVDDETMAKVKAEFEFTPRTTNIVDLGAHVGTCALCGKGDSKQTEGDDNRDKLRYHWRLSNIAGGEDLWVGSTCILNHALKVRGAETAEEARAILERTMRECLALWKAEAWRVANPDHAMIPKHYRDLSDFSHSFKNYGTYGSRGHDIYTLGQTQNGIYWKLRKLTTQMKAVSRFYERKSALTESKDATWKEARALLKSLNWMAKVLDETRNLPNERRTVALLEAKQQREAAFRAMKRTPRRL